MSEPLFGSSTPDEPSEDFQIPDIYHFEEAGRDGPSKGASLQTCFGSLEFQAQADSSAHL